MKRIVSILFLLIFQSVVAQVNPTFNHLTIEDGLANNSVRTIYQGNDGYLWLGTLNGLSRYDGKQFKNFAYTPGDSTSISNNKIRAIKQDSFSYLWILTYDNQIHRFDTRSEQFINFENLFKNKYHTNSIRFMTVGPNGTVWLASSDKGCFRIQSDRDPSEITIDHFSKKTFLPSDTVQCFFLDKWSHMWIGTAKGLTVYSAKENKSQTSFHKQIWANQQSVTCIKQIKNSIWIGCSNGSVYQLKHGEKHLTKIWQTPQWGGNKNTITFIEESQKGLICIGSFKGLLIYNSATKTKTYLNSRNSKLNTSYISGCYHDKYDNFWLITSRRGITRFIPDSLKFTNFPLHPEIRESILEGEKQIFTEDNNGNMWMGIYGGGISCFNSKTGKVRQFLQDSNQSESPASNLILSIYADQSDNLWIGTYKKGLDHVHFQHNNFNSQKINAKDQDQDFSTEVRALFQDSRNWIWAGNKKGEITVYDQQMHLLFNLENKLKTPINAGIYAITEDHKHQIWLGTKGKGIFILTNLPADSSQSVPKTIENVHLHSGLPEKQNLYNNNIFDICEDAIGQIWVACYHGGINIIRHPLQPDQVIFHYRHNETDQFSITDNRIRCFLKDNSNNMWIGTANGLNFLDSKYLTRTDKKFFRIQHESRSNSLSYNDVVSLFQDSKHQIWIGTYGGGLDLLQKDSLHEYPTFKSYSLKQGLSSNLILNISEDQYHQLWIGSDYGLNRLSEDSLEIASFYKIDGLPATSFSEGKSIYTHSGKIMIGTISGLVWFDPDSVKKSKESAKVVLTDLQINGQKDQPILTQARLYLDHINTKPFRLNHKQNSLSFEFAALDYKNPLNIQYQYKLENYESHWNHSGNLNRAIYRSLPPGKYCFLLQASNSDRQWVNKELRIPFIISTPPWNTIWAWIGYLLVGLGIALLIRKIILDRIKLRHEINYEKQLTEDKLKFYTSISHEFKTPLALILGPTEDLLKDKKLPTNIVRSLQMVKRNTMRLLELIEQLMDFRKLQKGFFKVNPSDRDLISFFNDIYQTFLSLAKVQKIHFEFLHSQNSFPAIIDYQALEKITFNLLSNAFKHTPKDKTITLKLQIDQQTHRIFIEVKDQGEGIKQEEINHIFSRFYHQAPSEWKRESNSGVGLALTRELVDLLNGEIQVESMPGSGSCFRIILPYQQTNSSNNCEEANLSYTEQFIQCQLPEEKMDEKLPQSKRESIVKKAKLLLIEDNQDLQDYLYQHFKENYEVHQAFNGNEGIDKAQKVYPDIIISDIMMPEKNGLEVTQILKGEFRTSHIPIILLTAKSLDEQKLEGIEYGADDYITKPFSMIYLEKRVANILKQRQQLKERFSQDNQIVPKELTDSKKDQEFLDQLSKIIDENMSNPDFSIEQILEYFSFGRTVFYKKIKGLTGYAPKEFIRILRMKKAELLLHQKDLNISEIAYQTGFSDPEYFSKIFKKHFGKSPSAYQNTL